MEDKRAMKWQNKKYSHEETTCWQLLFEQQIRQQACSAFLNGVELLNLRSSAIPDVGKLNQILKRCTGWQLSVVTGWVPPIEFFELLSKKIFPVACWLRKLKKIAFVHEPDFFHDVFGHVPLLTHIRYASFLQAFGELACACVNNREAVDLLSKIFWFTAEFGLIKEINSAKIYGAGILSSPLERMNIIKNSTLVKPFNFRDICRAGYRADRVQEQYFILESYNQLNELPGYLKQNLNNL